MLDNTGKEKEGILDLGPEWGCRTLNPECLNKSQEEKINSWKLTRQRVKTKDSIW